MACLYDAYTTIEARGARGRRGETVQLVNRPKPQATLRAMKASARKNLMRLKTRNGYVLIFQRCTGKRSGGSALNQYECHKVNGRFVGCRRVKRDAVPPARVFARDWPTTQRNLRDFERRLRNKPKRGR